MQLFSYKPVSIYGGTETSYSGVINQSCKYTSLNFEHPLTLKSRPQTIESSSGICNLIIGDVDKLEYVSYRYNSLNDMRLIYKAKDNTEITVYSLYKDQLNNPLKLFNDWSFSFSYNINPTFSFEFNFEIRVTRRSTGSGGGGSASTIVYANSAPYYCIDLIPVSSPQAATVLNDCISAGKTLYSLGGATPSYTFWLEVDLGFKEDIYS